MVNGQSAEGRGQRNPTTPGADTITITQRGPNLFYNTNGKELLLAAQDSTHFFTLKDDLTISFTKKTPALTLTQEKKNKQYMKL